MIIPGLSIARLLMAPEDDTAGASGAGEEELETAADDAAADDAAEAKGDEAGKGKGKGKDEPKPDAKTKPKDAPKTKGDKGGQAKTEKQAKAGKGAKTLLGAAADGEGDGEGDGGKAKAGKDGDATELDGWTPTLPEGQQVDEELLGELKTYAKDQKFQPGQLQGIVDLGVKMQARATQAFLDKHEETVAGYVEAARKDKEIGGAKLKGAVRDGLEAVKRFGGKEFETLMDELDRTGLGSHPAMIKLLARVHAATKDDDTVERTGTSAGAAPSKKSFADRMYPKMQEQLAAERSRRGG